MMKKLVNIAEGRSFLAGTNYDGLCKQIYEFLTANGWYEILDDRSNVTTPSVYLSNVAVPDYNDPDQIIVRIGYVVATSGEVFMRAYSGWDGGTNFYREKINLVYTFDSAEFVFNCRTDTDFINISTVKSGYYHSSTVLKLDSAAIFLENLNDGVTITSYNHVSTSQAEIFVTDSSGFTNGGKYNLFSSNYGNVKTQITAIDTGVSPHKISLSRIGSVDFSASIRNDSVFGTMPHKWVFQNTNSSTFRCFYYPNFTTPNDNDGLMLGYMYVSNTIDYVTINDILTAVYPITKPVFTFYDGTNDIDYNFIACPEFLYSGDYTPTPLGSGVNINGVDYIRIAVQNTSGTTFLNFYIEDGTV